jgi:hypothetical protein
MISVLRFLGLQDTNQKRVFNLSLSFLHGSFLVIAARSKGLCIRYICYAIDFAICLLLTLSSVFWFNTFFPVALVPACRFVWDPRALGPQIPPSAEVPELHPQQVPAGRGQKCGNNSKV